MELSGAEDAATLKGRLRTAIISTNLLAAPVLLVYIGVVFGFTIHTIGDDLNLDPYFIPLNFSLLIFVWAALVFAHLTHAMRYVRPMTDYLELAGSPGGGQERNPAAAAATALTASSSFPYRVMFWSVVYYIFGSPLAVASVQLLYSFSLGQSVILVVGIMAAGSLVSIFMYYACRRVMAGFQTQLLSDFPELLLRAGDGEVKVGIRVKFMSATIMLAGVLVVLTGTITFTASTRGLQRQLADWYLDRLQGEVKSLESAIQVGAGPTELESLAAAAHPIKGDRILLVGPDLQSLTPRPLDPAEKELIEIILKGAEGVERNRPSVHALGPQSFTAVVNREMDAVVHVPFEGGHLFVLAPASHYREVVTGMALMMVASIAIAILLAFIYASFSAADIREPLVALMDSIGALARGDLTRPVTVTGSDEIGVVARSLARAVSSLRRLIGRIGDTAATLDLASDAIGLKSSEVAAGSQSQVGAVDEASTAMDRMRGSAQGITDSISTLATSAQESSASIIEVQATVEEVAGNVEHLSAAVEQTGSSIHEMNGSIKQVAENVQGLARRSSEAMKALHEMERMIARVAESSRASGDISAEVTRDAESGARSVRSTISGIDRIREASGGLAEVITRLGKRAREIDNILNVIQDVTEETNLLALNAAIIAAQAGEHGRGFAVVADEIKDLAERTAASTQEIAELIHSVQSDAGRAVEEVQEGVAMVAEGVKLSQEGGAALDKIQASVRRAIEQTNAIAEAAGVQAQKSRQVMDFMNGLDTMIAQVARSTQEQTRTGDQIAAAAVRMEEIARQVKKATKEQAQGSRYVTQAIEHIAEIARYINDAQAEQLRNTERVRSSVDRISEAARGNQARVDDMTGTVNNLKQQADGLRALLAEFKL